MLALFRYICIVGLALA